MEYINSKIGEIKDVKEKNELKNVLVDLRNKLELLDNKTTDYYTNKLEDSSFKDEKNKQKELELEYRRRQSL